MDKLKEGEKYLNVSIGGKEGIRVALFPNKKKEKPTDPDFIGNIGLACWISQKKPEAPKIEGVL